MQTEDDAERPVKKATGFMTNSSCIAQRLNKKCNKSHKHIVLVNGRAKQAEVYPVDLCAFTSSLTVLDQPVNKGVERSITLTRWLV